MNMIKDYQENYGTGWISLYRSIKEHWIWDDPVNLKMWIDFLMRANHKENKIIIEGQLISIPRGSFITSLKKLATEYGVSMGKIRHFLEILKNDSMILLNTTHRFTQLTICNYETYQNGQHTESTLNEIRMKSESTLNETNNNDNNDNNVNNKREAVLYPIKEVKKEYFINLLPIDATQQFIEAWNEWVDFRREIKKKLTVLTAKKQLTFLFNQPDPIKCINQSIQNGWTGLFEVADKTKPKVAEHNGRVVTKKEDEEWRKVLAENEKKLKEQGAWNGKINF